MAYYYGILYPREDFFANVTEGSTFHAIGTAFPSAREAKDQVMQEHVDVVMKNLPVGAFIVETDEYGIVTEAYEIEPPRSRARGRKDNPVFAGMAPFFFSDGQSAPVAGYMPVPTPPPAPAPLAALPSAPPSPTGLTPSELRAARRARASGFPLDAARKGRAPAATPPPAIVSPTTAQRSAVVAPQAPERPTTEVPDAPEILSDQEIEVRLRTAMKDSRPSASDLPTEYFGQFADFLDIKISDVPSDNRKARRVFRDAARERFGWEPTRSTPPPPPRRRSSSSRRSAPSTPSRRSAPSTVTKTDYTPAEVDEIFNGFIDLANAAAQGKVKSSSGATKSLRDALTASSAFPIEAADEIAERLGLDFTKVKAEAEAKRANTNTEIRRIIYYAVEDKLVEEGVIPPRRRHKAAQSSAEPPKRQRRRSTPAPAPEPPPPPAPEPEPEPARRRRRRRAEPPKRLRRSAPAPAPAPEPPPAPEPRAFTDEEKNAMIAAMNEGTDKLLERLESGEVRL